MKSTFVFRLWDIPTLTRTSHQLSATAADMASRGGRGTAPSPSLSLLALSGFASKAGEKSGLVLYVYMYV